ncbi:histidine phosphatase family protein [Uliginosibacterium paludis]|uniref:Histidine phosphatase family protein n=1 Tax=Uliginosibacterium paludis TaxID=1615952 RepID=A0ABV2CKR2_9RHOO
MPITRICLVRHGETAWNAETRLQGHEDIALNARGREQARAAAEALKAHAFSAIYSSDLIRARETAEAIAHDRGQSVQLDAGLRERHFGMFQGLTREEADQLHPGEYARLRTREPEATPPGGGESLLAFAARVSTTIRQIAERHADSQILVVCHGGCLDVIYRMVTGKLMNEPRDFPLGNATLNWIESGKDGWKLLAWDERAHLTRSQDEIAV